MSEDAGVLNSGNINRASFLWHMTSVYSRSPVARGFSICKPPHVAHARLASARMKGRSFLSAGANA
jgi:hypothetical protein